MGTARGEIPQFEVRVDVERTPVVVSAVGELDFAVVSNLERVVRAQLAAGDTVLDLSQLTFMDSSGIRLLDGLLRDAAREGWELTVRRELTAPVRQVLAMTAMLDQLRWAD